VAIQLSGPFAFTPAAINAAVTLKSPGVYALGYTRNNTFYIQRVGRSDFDLNARLQSDEYKGKYSQFKAWYYPNADAAFHAECELWHTYGNFTDNPNHPARPTGKNHKCNHCKLF
jgi:hypothetical protein